MIATVSVESPGVCRQSKARALMPELLPAAAALENRKISRIATVTTVEQGRPERPVARRGELHLDQRADQQLLAAAEQVRRKERAERRREDKARAGQRTGSRQRPDTRRATAQRLA